MGKQLDETDDWEACGKPDLEGLLIRFEEIFTKTDKHRTIISFSPQTNQLRIRQ
jgi:hypothetical protein